MYSPVQAAIDCGKQRVNLLQEYKFVDCDIWYVRFSMDFKQRLLACGNKSGSVFVWNGKQATADSLFGTLLHKQSMFVVVLSTHINNFFRHHGNGIPPLM